MGDDPISVDATIRDEIDKISDDGCAWAYAGVHRYNYGQLVPPTSACSALRFLMYANRT